MARRRGHRRHTSHRRHRRRVGALRLGGKDTTVKLLSVGAGFLLGPAINKMVDGFLPKTTDPVPVPTKNASTVAAVGMVGLGGLLLMQQRSQPILKYAGGVLLGAGLKRALSVLGVIQGYQSVPVIGRHHRMAGYQSVPVIGANVVPPQLAGMRTPPQLSGYIPAGSGVGGYIPAGSGVSNVMGSIGTCDSSSGITNTSGSGYLS
jgi:hypothetical protein